MMAMDNTGNKQGSFNQGNSQFNAQSYRGRGRNSNGRGRGGRGSSNNSSRGSFFNSKTNPFQNFGHFHRIPNHKGHNSRSVESLDICPLINFTEWIITIKDAILLPN